MKTEILALEHKNLLFKKLKKDTKIAEYSFANIYLFRDTHKYEVLFLDNLIFIKGYSYDGMSYIMPVSDLNEIGDNVFNDLLNHVDLIFPIDENWLGKFNNKGYVIEYKDGDTDYVYEIEKLRTFAGKKLHSKRNLLHQFEKNYICEALPLFGERLIEAKEVLEKWQEESNQPKEDTDYKACLEALNLYDELILCGYIYYIDKKPAGFIIGEELCYDTFALHFAKGLVEYKGIYQFMFNSFAKILPEKYKFVNFEQDLDKENLRLAKKSYEPDILLKKYRIKK
ncbi:MAG: DUF2156 domain-containing protein [Proteobacteria bacterium]|nr:DUF2156 domain-containing protein [Pseudomonadota bacterium]